MAKDDVMRQFWAAIFLVIGIAIVGWVIFYLGFRKGLTEPRFEVTVLFDKIGGLTEGSPVRLSGVTVGTVKSVGFLTEEVMGRGINVTLDVYKKFDRQVRRCTQVAILTEGVLGAKYVEFGRDAGEAPLNIDQPILAEPLMDIYDLAGTLQDTASSFQSTTRGINSMMHEVQYISRKTKRLMDRIEQRVIDGNLFKVF